MRSMNVVVWSYLVLLLGEFIREGNEELAESFALERGQGQNTRQVVIVG